MSNAILSVVTHRKKTFWALGILVLVAAWWAFRPEKLFINERVNEPAPFATSTGPQPVLTGALADEAHHPVGRATIYKTPEGHDYLRISGLSASAAQLNVALKGMGAEMNVGALQNPSGQNFDLAASVDLNQYDSVVIYMDHTGTFAIAKLQPF